MSTRLPDGQLDVGQLCKLSGVTTRGRKGPPNGIFESDVWDADGLGYTAPIPEEAVAAHDLARALPEEMWTAVTDRLVAEAKGTRCVDVGIGSGAVGGRLSTRGMQVAGLDCNTSMLRALRAVYPDVPAVLGDAESLPFCSDQADLVVMACLLHLVADWRRALREAIRVAAPSAALAVNVGASALAGRTEIGRMFLDAVTSRVDLPPMPGPALEERFSTRSKHRAVVVSARSTCEGRRCEASATTSFGSSGTRLAGRRELPGGPLRRPPGLRRAGPRTTSTTSTSGWKRLSRSGSRWFAVRSEGTG